MEYRKINGTEISVSVVGLGCWAIVGDATWGHQEYADTEKTVYKALDVGINLFDTAEMYGNGYSEELLGKLIKGKRERVVIANKVSRENLSAQRVISSCEASLQRLQTDYIDLYQIHWPNSDIPAEETVSSLNKLKKQGKIREYGISNFGTNDLDTIIPCNGCRTNQLPYNLLWRSIEFEITKKCEQNDIGIICYSPLAQGLLTGKFASAADVPEGRARTRHFSSERPQARHGEPGFESQTFAAIDRIRDICEKAEEPMAPVALNWLIHQPGVLTVAAGARTPTQVASNARGAELRLSTEIFNELTRATEEIKELSGANPDMWQGEENTRIH